METVENNWKLLKIVENGQKRFGVWGGRQQKPPYSEKLADGKRPLEKLHPMAQTDKQTDGHRDSKTESVVLLKCNYLAPILGGFLKMHLFLLLLQKILPCWQNCVPIPNFSDQNLAIQKIYPPYLKGVQVKTTQKWCFPSLSQLEFGSEWQS